MLSCPVRSEPHSCASRHDPVQRTLAAAAAAAAALAVHSRPHRLTCSTLGLQFGNAPGPAARTSPRRKSPTSDEGGEGEGLGASPVGEGGRDTGASGDSRGVGGEAVASSGMGATAPATWPQAKDSAVSASVRFCLMACAGERGSAGCARKLAGRQALPKKPLRRFGEAGRDARQPSAGTSRQQHGAPPRLRPGHRCRQS